MKRIDYLLILAVLMFVSCGKSSKEIQAEQQSRKQAEQVAYQKAYKIAVMPTMDCLPAYLLKVEACRRLSPISYVRNG